MKIEICLDNLNSVAAAAEAGAHRIELCAGLAEGGLTPSIGVLKQARACFSGEIAMMIRPRGGDFLYSPLELASMADDIRLAADHGADAVVFGCLTAEGDVDREVCTQLLKAADGFPAVFHRAFDVSRDLGQSLETLIELGFIRILTSGGEPDAVAGTDTLRQLIKQAQGRIGILPGGGIKPDQAQTLVASTGADQIHLTGRTLRESPMTFRKPDIPMGASSLRGEYEHADTTAATIRRLLETL